MTKPGFCPVLSFCGEDPRGSARTGWSRPTGKRLLRSHDARSWAALRSDRDKTMNNCVLAEMVDAHHYAGPAPTRKIQPQDTSTQRSNQ